MACKRVLCSTVESDVVACIRVLCSTVEIFSIPDCCAGEQCVWMGKQQSLGRGCIFYKNSMRECIRVQRDCATKSAAAQDPPQTCSCPKWAQGKLLISCNYNVHNIFPVKSYVYSPLDNFLHSPHCQLLKLQYTSLTHTVKPLSYITLNHLHGLKELSILIISKGCVYFFFPPLRWRAFPTPSAFTL